MTNKNFLHSVKNPITILRFSVALVFLLHAIVRLYNNTIPNFALFFSSMGFPFPTLIVWLITIFEIAGSILLILNFFTKWISAGLILILLVGIILIHARLGWFVGEHGTGGVEYSFILIVCLYCIWTQPTPNKVSKQTSIGLSAEDVTC